MKKLSFLTIILVAILSVTSFAQGTHIEKETGIKVEFPEYWEVDSTDPYSQLGTKSRVVITHPILEAEVEIIVMDKYTDKDMWVLKSISIMETLSLASHYFSYDIGKINERDCYVGECPNGNLHMLFFQVLDYGGQSFAITAYYPSANQVIEYQVIEMIKGLTFKE